MPLTPLQQQAVEESGRQGVDPAVALALAEQESNFDPRAVSLSGVEGLYQVTQPVWQDYGGGKTPRSDAATSARIGLNYLADQIKRYGSIEAGLAHYGDPAQKTFSAEVMARVPKWRKAMAEGPDRTAEDFYAGMPGAQAGQAGGMSAEQFYDSMQAKPAQAQETYQGPLAGLSKELKPEDYPTLSYLMAPIPGSREMIRHGGQYVRDIARMGVETGTAAGALAATAPLHAGPQALATVPLTTAAAGVVSHRANQALGLEPGGAEGATAGLGAGDVGPAAWGALGGLPQGFLRWLRAPARGALSAADVKNKAKIAQYLDDLNTYRINTLAGKPATPPSAHVLEQPQIPERGLVSKTLEQILPYESAALLGAFVTHPLATLKAAAVPAALTGADMYRRAYTARMLDPANLMRLRALRDIPLPTQALTVGTAEEIRQRLGQ